MARNNWARDSFRNAQNLMSKGYSDFEPTTVVTKSQLNNLKSVLLSDEQIARDNTQQPTPWYEYPDEAQMETEETAAANPYTGEEPITAFDGEDFNLDTIQQDAIDYEEKNAYRNKDPNRAQSDFDRFAAPDDLTEDEFKKKQSYLAIQQIEKEIKKTEYSSFTKMTPGEKGQRDKRIEELKREQRRLMELYRGRDWSQDSVNEKVRTTYKDAEQKVIDEIPNAKKLGSKVIEGGKKTWNENKDKLDPNFVSMIEETIPGLVDKVPGLLDKGMDWIENINPVKGFTDTGSDDMDTYMDMLMDEEGFEPVGVNKFNEEYNTIGHGHNGPEVREGMPMNERQAANLLRQDIEKRLPKIQKAIPKFDKLPIDVKRHVVGSWFRGSLSGSPKTIKLINAGQYAKAADEFLDNHEYKTTELRGVKKRMKATADALRSLEGR